MSATYTCTDCHHPIPAGQAVLRSVSFVRVAYCQPCATDNGIAPAKPWAPAVAPQRVA